MPAAGTQGARGRGEEAGRVGHQGLAYVSFPPAAGQVEIEGDPQLVERPHVLAEAFPRKLP